MTSSRSISFSFSASVTSSAIDVPCQDSLLDPVSVLIQLLLKFLEKGDLVIHRAVVGVFLHHEEHHRSASKKAVLASLNGVLRSSLKQISGELLPALVEVAASHAAFSRALGNR